MRFGVLQFPGSCDDLDALAAARRVGDAELIWHAERDLRGADAIVVPGGFSYGDYLRAGAIARFAPAMESVVEFAADGGLVLGICNGFQVLCEARLLPGALLPNANLRFTFRQLQLEVVRADTAFTSACRAEGEPPLLSIPAKHSWGRYYADELVLRAREPERERVLEAGQLLGVRHAHPQRPYASTGRSSGRRPSRRSARRPRARGGASCRIHCRARCTRRRCRGRSR